MNNEKIKNKIKQNIIDYISTDTSLNDKEVLNLIDNEIDRECGGDEPIKLRDKLALRKQVFDSFKKFFYS